MEAKADIVWSTASRAHVNRDFRFNSQPLTVAFTEYKSLGGRSWPNVRFESEKFDYAFALWGNSTLGILLHWWHSSRQDSGRGTTTIRSAESLPVLDLRTLTDDQLSTAESIFDEFRDKDLKPAYLADSDPNRALLDRRVICDLLGFDRDRVRGRPEIVCQVVRRALRPRRQEETGKNPACRLAKLRELNYLTRQVEESHWCSRGHRPSHVARCILIRPRCICLATVLSVLPLDADGKFLCANPIRSLLRND